MPEFKLSLYKTNPPDEKAFCELQHQWVTLPDRGSLLFLLGEEREQGTSVSQGTSEYNRQQTNVVSHVVEQVKWSSKSPQFPRHSSHHSKALFWFSHTESSTADRWNQQHIKRSTVRLCDMLPITCLITCCTEANHLQSPQGVTEKRYTLKFLCSQKHPWLGKISPLIRPTRANMHTRGLSLFID